MKEAENIIETLPGGISFEMVFVEGGTFMMGSEKEDAFSWEKPIHGVKLDSFYIGKYTVTQASWKVVMEADNNPSHFKGDNRPVERISWDDTQKFIEKLNKKTGRSYRLLTEAEWEYAARGGVKNLAYKYAGSNKLKDIGWYEKNSYGETKPVGLKYPNESGIYDMSGNVWEWCQDRYSGEYYQACHQHGIVENPTGSKEGSGRVVRGGSWAINPQLCRVSYRFNYGPAFRSDDVGFRLGLSLQSVASP